MSTCFDPRLKSDINAEKLSREEKEKKNYSAIKHMTVGQLVNILQKIDSDLPVCLADWNEEYQQDNNDVVANVHIGKGRFTSHSNDCFGNRVVIG